MTVAEAQARITAREFAEWQAFFTIEPFGEWRRDYRNGILVAATLNMWRGKGDKPVGPEDFVPVFGRRPTAIEPLPPSNTEQEFLEAMGAKRVDRE
jgi:hypothetical protein